MKELRCKIKYFKLEDDDENLKISPIQFSLSQPAELILLMKDKLLSTQEYMWAYYGVKFYEIQVISIITVKKQPHTPNHTMCLSSYQIRIYIGSLNYP